MAEIFDPSSIIDATSIAASTEINILEFEETDDTGIDIHIENVFDYAVNSSIYYNIDYKKYSGDWWLFASTSKTNNYVGFEYDRCYRTKCNYKWNCKQNEYDVKYYCYTERPNIIKKCIYNDAILEPRPYITIDENTGQYFTMDARLYPAKPNIPKKMVLTFNINKDKSTIPNFVIHKTDYENYSIISTPNKKYIWIFARQYALSHKHIKRLYIYLKELKIKPASLYVDISAIYKK